MTRRPAANDMTGRHLPNAVTLTRLAAIPFLYRLSFAETAGGISLAGGLFVLLTISDWLDGYLARRLDARSRLGTLLDPVVDKVLVLTVLFVFAAKGLWPLWLVLLNMLREFVVSALRHGLSTQTAVVGANWMGKTKFCLQTAVCILGYVVLAVGHSGRPFPGGTRVSTGALAVVTVASFAFLGRFIWWHRQELFGGGSPR